MYWKGGRQWDAIPVHGQRGTPRIGCIKIKLLLTNVSQIPIPEDIRLDVPVPVAVRSKA